MSDEQTQYPRLVLLGVTGAGKSTLFNALLEGDYQRVGVTPTTQTEREVHWRKGRQTTILVDTPGTMEAGKHDDRLDALLGQLAEAHAVIIVVGYPNRAVEWESSLCRQIRELEPEIPILVAGTRVDAVSRQFNADSFEPARRRNDAEEKVSKWAEYLTDTFEDADEVILCSGGESPEDRDRQYNLDGLNEAIEESLPAAARIDHIRRLRLIEDKGTRAQMIIGSAAVAAAGAALVPIPLADAVVISGIQATMIVALANLYDLELTAATAGGLVGAAVAGVLGPMAVQQLVKLLPVAGSVIGAGVAGVVTLAMGQTFNSFFMQGNFSPNPDDIKREMKKRYKDAKKRKHEFE